MVATSLVSPAISEAGVTFGPATRQVTAIAGFDPPIAQSFSAPGPWSESVFHEYTDGYHLPGSPSWGRAEQTSDIGHAGQMAYITGAGSQGGYDGFSVGGAGAGMGSNGLSVAFTLDAASQADLFLRVAPGSTYVTSFFARLTGPSGPVLTAGDFGSTWHGAALPPGAYTFEAYFRDGWEGASTGGGSGSWSLALTIPSPATASAVLLPLLPRRRR